MAVLKNVENKIKLVMIVSSLFLVGCVIVSLGSIIIAKGMVDEAHKKVYVLDGTVPILVKQTTQEETFDVEAKSDIEMFHQFFFTLAPDDKYIQYTMKKAMYLVDETGLAQYNALKEKGLDVCSVLVRLEHIFGEIAVNALRSRVRLRVEINHAILDVGNIELVNEHALEHGRYALWEGKFELRRHRTVVTAGFDYIGRVDAVGQLACVLRALVARNHTYRKHDKQDSNQK